MADKKSKKSIFGKAIDAISNRDEKEDIRSLEDELAEAKKEAAAAKEAIKSMLDQNADVKKDKYETEKAVEEKEKRIAELERKLREKTEAERKDMIEERRKAREEAMNKLEELKKPKIIATYVVDEENPTLSHIALKYYKHATPPYWKYLVEHNKELLDGSEKNLRLGMEIVIPELPEELKD